MIPYASGHGGTYDHPRVRYHGGICRIREDWQAKYGHPVHALESFVDRSRFKGTCYRAANWMRLGATQGRTRNDRDRSIQAPVKAVYLYPLNDFFGCPMSEGPLANIIAQSHELAADPAGKIKALVEQAAVAHFDETGLTNTATRRSRSCTTSTCPSATIRPSATCA